MAKRTDSPLLASGNEAEWAKINEEEARQEAEFAASLSMDERVTRAGRLLAASRIAFHSTRQRMIGPLSGSGASSKEPVTGAPSGT
jgi:hypothetical protein